MSIAVPTGGTPFARRDVAGFDDPHAADSPGRTGSIEHVVAHGETAWGIAKRHLGDGRRYRELLDANRHVIGDDPDRIRPGMTLRIPKPVDRPDRTPVGRHEVAPGETLRGIARRHLGDASRFRELYDANRALIGGDPDRIRPGTVLQIPGLAAQRAPAEPAAAAPSPVPPPPPPPPPPAPPPPPVDAAPPSRAPAAAAAPRTEAPARGVRAELTVRSFVSPSGVGPNTSLGGRTFVGASLRDAEGRIPSGWAGVPQQPYREVFAGMSVGGVTFDPATRAFDVVTPRAVAGYASGDARSNLIVQSWRDLEPDAGGRHAVGAQASWARLDDRGRAQVRVDAQVASPPPGAGTTPKWSGRTDLFVPLDDAASGHHLRLRAAGSHTGLPGQATSVAVSATLNTAPNPGTFPAGKPDAGFKPHLDVTVARTAAPAPGDPGRTSTRIAVTGGALSPRTVATATVSRTETAGVAATQLGVAALQRLGRNDVGQPPTSVTAGGIDPINMPTGSYPAGVRGQNTSAYLLGTVTLADAGITPTPGAFPGRDRVVAGVVHTTSHGRVASAYAQVTVDATRYADDASPQGGRARVDAGAHIRVFEEDGPPLTLHVGAGGGGGGNSVQGGVNLMVDPNTTVGAGVRYVFDAPDGRSGGELQPYAQIRIRL